MKTYFHSLILIFKGKDHNCLSDFVHSILSRIATGLIKQIDIILYFLNSGIFAPLPFLALYFKHSQYSALLRSALFFVFFFKEQMHFFSCQDLLNWSILFKEQTM